MNPTTTRSTVVDLDTRIYRLAAIKKAAYKFGDRCDVHIESCDDNKVRVTLRPKRLLETAEAVRGEFQNEVLDQELREVVAAETEAVRNLIIAQAFSQTSLLDPTGETADYHDDPLEISKSDEQKARFDAQAKHGES